MFCFVGDRENWQLLINEQCYLYLACDTDWTSGTIDRVMLYYIVYLKTDKCIVRQITQHTGEGVSSNRLRRCRNSVRDSSFHRITVLTNLRSLFDETRSHVCCVIRFIIYYVVRCNCHVVL